MGGIDLPRGESHAIPEGRGNHSAALKRTRTTARTGTMDAMSRWKERSEAKESQRRAGFGFGLGLGFDPWIFCLNERKTRQEVNR